LEIAATVSEKLGLPTYIDADTAYKVSKKSSMKKVFKENGIPTSDYVILSEFKKEDVSHLKFPLIVKPVDSYSSRGVKRAEDHEELLNAFNAAMQFSREKKVVVEEFNVGRELTVDVYVENGKANILCISELSKIPGNDRFVIHRNSNPADVSEAVQKKIECVSGDIAKAFGLSDSPMLIQLIQNGDDISVVEFCARTGGGDKFRLIEKVSGFNVVTAVLELTLGNKPHYEKKDIPKKYIINEFLYCREGVLESYNGFDELLREGIISEYFLLKTLGHRFPESITSSGDRAAFITVEAKSKEELYEKHARMRELVAIRNDKGEDILRHDLMENLRTE
jgi:biotin carboxylase